MLFANWQKMSIITSGTGRGTKEFAKATIYWTARKAVSEHGIRMIQRNIDLSVLFGFCLVSPSPD